jgi:RNA polymerase sigma factor (sigma-70 family)
MSFGQHDDSAFAALLEQHAGILRKVAATYAFNPADRRDLIQDITLQLWKAYPRYDPARPFSTWMYRIALNVGISWMRTASRAAFRTVSLDALGLDPAGSPGGDRETDEQVALLHRCIARLNPLDRALLLLYLDDQSYREIADVLGISETNVGAKISRLKQRLRQDMLTPA